MDDLTRIKNALTEIGCEKHLQKFIDEEIDWEEFLLLDKETLNKKMDIPMGVHSQSLFSSFVLTRFVFVGFQKNTEPAVKILNYIAKQKGAPSSPSSITQPFSQIDLFSRWEPETTKAAPSSSPQQLHPFAASLRDDPAWLNAGEYTTLQLDPQQQKPTISVQPPRVVQPPTQVEFF
jgi:hypothetical protein